MIFISIDVLKGRSIRTKNQFTYLQKIRVYFRMTVKKQIHYDTYIFMLFYIVNIIFFQCAQHFKSDIIFSWEKSSLFTTEITLKANKHFKGK